MEPQDIRSWNNKVKMLERTEAIIEQQSAIQHRPTAFYEGLSLFFAQGYDMLSASDDSHGIASQRVA